MRLRTRVQLLGLLAIGVMLFTLPPVLAGGAQSGASCPRGQSIRAITAGGAAVCNQHPIRSTANETGGLLRADGQSFELADLEVPRGTYLFVAKGQVGPPTAGQPFNRNVECALRAGSESDVITVTTDTTISHAAFTLTVARTFGGKSVRRRATLRCRMVGPTTQTVRKRVTRIKLMAVQGGVRIATG